MRKTIFVIFYTILIVVIVASSFLLYSKFDKIDIEKINQLDMVLSSCKDKLDILNSEQEKLSSFSAKLEREVSIYIDEIKKQTSSIESTKENVHQLELIQSRISQSFILLNTDIKQISDTQRQLNEILLKVKNYSPIGYREDLSLKFLEKAEDRSIYYEKRNILYIIALNNAIDKDIVLRKYIAFVENQISKIENKDEAINLFETLVSNKNDSLPHGTPQNIMDAEIYEELIDKIFTNNREKLTPPTNEEMLNDSLKEELDNILKIKHNNSKLMALNNFSSKCESAELQYHLEQKEVPEYLFSLLNIAKTNIDEILKNKAIDQESSTRNYQRMVLDSIYKFREYRNGLDKKFKDKEIVRSFLCEVKSKLLWIDLTYTNQSVSRLYQQEYEEVYNKLKNFKRDKDFDPIKELAMAEIETKKIQPF